MIILENFTLEQIITKAKENIIVIDITNSNTIILENGIINPSYADLDLFTIVINYINNIPVKVIYTAKSFNNNNKDISLERDIIIEEIPPLPDKHCCYPPVYYLETQNRYKLGSSNTRNYKRARIIIKSHKYN